MLSKRADKYLEKKKEESGNITYIYSKKHIEGRNKGKMKRLKQLSKSLSKLRSQVKKDLKSDDPETKYTALAVALIDETYERIGNVESARDLKHYGVSSWLKKHITFSGGKAKIKYVGKSGVKQEKEVGNSAVVSALKDALKDKKPNDKVLSGEDYNITGKKVNSYLSSFKISAKDIRGLHANEEMRKALKQVRKGKLPSKDDEKDREKKLKEEFKEALEIAAKRVGHEPATLKNQYLIPTMEPDYMKDGRIGTLAAEQFSLSKRAEELKLYHYAPKKNSVEKEGVKSPFVLLDENDKETLNLYRDRVADYLEKDKKEVDEKDLVLYLEHERGKGGSMMISALTEPLPEDVSKSLNDFRKDSELYEIDLSALLNDNKIDNVIVAEVDKEGNEVLIDSDNIPAWINKIKSNSIDWKENKEFLFENRPHFMIAIEGGVIEPKYLEKVELSKEATLSKRAARETPCQTPDAVYETEIHPDEVRLKVELPEKKELNKKEEDLLIDELHNVVELVVSKHYFNKDAALSKRANLQPIPQTPNVVIEPMDSLVQQAVNGVRTIDPALLHNITKVVVHQGGGSGQLGHVEMGPGKDPREVHIFKDRIVHHVRNHMTGRPEIDIQKSVVHAIMETIAHEAGHIGKSRTQQQILTQPFFGEPEAERQEQEFRSKISIRDFSINKKANDWTAELNLWGVKNEQDLLATIRRMAERGMYRFTNHCYDQLNREEAGPRTKEDIIHSLKTVIAAAPRRDNAIIVLGFDKEGMLVENIIQFQINKNKTEMVLITCNLRAKPYRYELEEETKQKASFSNIMLQASLLLEDIREKYLPHKPATEPSLNFISYILAQDVENILKEGVDLLLADKTYSAILDIEKAVKYNGSLSNKSKTLIKAANFMNEDPSSKEFVIELMKWQIEHGLKPTGELDIPTVERFKKEQQVPLSGTPADKPFGTTIPGYEPWYGEISSNPYGIFTVPAPLGGHG